MFRSLCDWSWVLFAYLCGKVLHIKKYCPIRNQHNSSMALVRWSFPITASRLTKLMRLWGYRMATVEEVQKMQEKLVPPTLPRLRWNNDKRKWETYYQPQEDDWKKDHRFTAIW